MISLLFMVFGLFLFGCWYFLRRKSQASMAWPSTRGTVTASDVNRYRGSDGEWSEEARVVYEYAVAGASFRGNRITFGGASTGTRAAARKTVARYPAGASVEVFYDPTQPGSAVLERKMSGALAVLAVVGGLFALIGIVALFVGR